MRIQQQKTTLLNQALIFIVFGALKVSVIKIYFKGICNCFY